MDAQWSNTINFYLENQKYYGFTILVINFAILMKQENGPRIFHVKDQDLILLVTLAKLIGIVGEDKICHYE